MFRQLCLLLAFVALLTTARLTAAEPVPASEQAARTEATPRRLEGIDVEEHLDAAIPLDLVFNDESGQPIALREIVDGSVPVVFTLNYSDCPMLCSLQLNGLTESLKQLEWTANREFRIVTVSLNPGEKPSRALETKRKYLKIYGRPEAEPGWHFLTGSERNVQALAAALGVRYAYNEKRNEYVHPAVVTLVTPAGRIGRYLYGIQYHPKTLRLSLVEVSEGKVGSTIDRLILYCFHYDETEGRYAPLALKIMRFGGLATLLVLGLALGGFWIAERRRSRQGTA